jgi:hypothetical protein
MISLLILADPDNAHSLGCHGGNWRCLLSGKIGHRKFNTSPPIYFMTARVFEKLVVLVKTLTRPLARNGSVSYRIAVTPLCLSPLRMGSSPVATGLAVLPICASSDRQYADGWQPDRHFSFYAS